MPELRAHERLLRTTASPTKAGDWTLVLAAAGIPYRVDEGGGQFAIVVDADDEARAAEALAGFDEEGAPEVAPTAPDRGRSPLGLLAAIGFSAMFLVSGARDGGSRWFDAGAANAELIAHGAWWRAVTALTLHGDLLHLAGNVVASLIFISAVGRWLGTGLGGALILASATAANLLTAAVHRKAFVSIGASTATFAALGLCVGLQVVRRLKLGTRRGYVWVPIGAALALYAMTGVGPDADRYAHLFGIGMGTAVGLGAAYAQLGRGWQPPRAAGQALLGTLAAGAVVGAWLLAFGAAHR
jgi:membrane associated rhomboid family serine protease